MTIEEARERVARVAEKDGETLFAREVRAGCWDHRSDVQAALRGERLRGEGSMIGWPGAHLGMDGLWY